MEVLRFNKYFYNEMQEWYKKRNIISIPLEYLPEIGFIIPRICAGFLYQADGKMGLIENIITNPDISSKDRNSALNLIVDYLLKEAKIIKLKYIIGTIKEASILKRAINVGCKDIGQYHIVYKEL